MEGAHRSWPPQHGGSAHAGAEQGTSQAPRAGTGYGPAAPQHQNPQSPPSGHVGLPPPGGPFPPFHQPAHSLASLAGLNQSPPRQPPSQAHRSELQQSQPPPGSGFALPGIGHATGQHSGLDRERERAREAEHIQIKEEEDRRYRDQERHRLDQAAPLHTQAGPPVHLHQPVAVGPRSVHGPNGLLANPAISGPPQPPQLPLGAPSGPSNMFSGGPVQPAQSNASQQMQPAMLVPYGPGAPAPSTQQQHSSQNQGQQPILNDALSYLDQVKVQFQDHPDVYNRFLDIMKDFKSGTIDTPGVIGRVSTLFAGNPDLIQGFNTFLPPGYRIDCGTGDDPNAIRVTTPMGTTVQSMPQPRPLSRQEGPDGLRPTNGSYTPQPGPQSAQLVFSPSGRPLGPASANQPPHLASFDATRPPEQPGIHPYDQRGASAFPGGTSASAGPGMRSGASPRVTPAPGQDSAVIQQVDGSQAPPGLEKRGPVEFNHAISYVNKIKNRFASHPDIYKQFLEILQTYQRESKPIQDVYSQVTHLFKTAPDLLEDFKQFLPESAAQAKAAERARQQAEEKIMISNIRETGGGGGVYGSPVMSREAQISTPGQTRGGLPPVGNFAPTPTSKEIKRKRGDRQGTAGAVSDGLAGPVGKPQFGGVPGKRLKQTHPMVKGPSEQPPASPTLIPQLPTPLEPTTTSAATSDELNFFDKAKKSIGNKNVMNEFLKLCNLFSQDLVDRSTLVHRARSFIGSNPELLKWFQDWVGYDEKDILIENKPRIPTGRVTLSNCRGLGPSYRLLPKRERQKPCSGRDELCNSVLNDEWASHPTWASEDSGFIAHRKNIHEEGLHRIEEERHDYDFNIEGANRTIQLLEPIATQLRRMDEASQRSYTLPSGLGGQSETIYKRVIMKMYGREKGSAVIESLHQNPYQVIPVLLNRLKERLESWKLAQREWEKVWREQTQKMFWRSLDHQAVQLKSNDRRQFQLKTLQNEVQVKYEEMKRASHANPGIIRQPQLAFTVDDPNVIVDATYLVLVHVEMSMSTDHPQLYAFVRDFAPVFFGLDGDSFREEIHDRMTRAAQSQGRDDSPSGGDDAASTKARKGASKNGSLLRTALDRGRKMTRRDREESGSASRASTPDIASNMDDGMSVDAPDEVDLKQDVSTGRWLEHPISGNVLGAKDINPQEPHRRDLYRCWANATIYSFIRLFITLYERLHKLKQAEKEVREMVQTAQMAKQPAIELGIIDKVPKDFFADTSDGAHYYGQMLQKFEDVLKGDLEFADVEDALRRFYLQSGYPLYAFEKIVGTLGRNASLVVNGDSKDKSAEIYSLFKKDRLRDVTTAQQQTDYRKAVEKMVKDAELYRVDYDQAETAIRIYLAKKDEPASTSEGLSALDAESRWRYYIASYTSVDNTDGIDLGKVAYPFLMGNLRAYGVADPHADRSHPAPLGGADGDGAGDHATAATPGAAAAATPAAPTQQTRFLEMKNDEKLNVRIAVNNYRAFFQPDTFESWHAPLRDRDGGKPGVEAAEDAHVHRQEAMTDGFVMNNSGMKDLSKDDVERKMKRWEELVAGDG